MLRKIEGGRRRGRQRMRWLDGITDSMGMSLSNSGSWWWIGRPGVLQSMGSQRVGHDWEIELNWTESELRHFRLFVVNYQALFPPLACDKNVWCGCLYFYEAHTHLHTNPSMHSHWNQEFRLHAKIEHMLGPSVICKI